MNWWQIFHIALFIGAVQGIVLGLDLWRTKAPRSRPNRILACILFFFAYRLIIEALRSMDMINFNSWTYHAFLDYHWIYGPLLYLYIRSYIYREDRFSRRDLVHLIPVVVEFIISNYVKIQNFYWDGTQDSLSWLGRNAYIQWMHKPWQYIVLSVLIIFYVFQSRKLINGYTSSHSKLVQMEDIRWLEKLLTWFLIYAVSVIIFTMLDFGFYDYAFNPFFKFPVFISMAILVYWMGLQAYGRKHSDYLLPEVKKTKPTITVDPNLHQRITFLMESEELYKNPKLTLTLLAAALDVKSYQVTHVLNTHFKKNFSDFINQYRVSEAIRMINDTEYDHYTLLSLAYESGFNSKASFNRIVKKLTGKSPKELKIAKK